MAGKRAWTVLVYANGNNDLDMNIVRQFEMIRDAKLPENIHAVVELALRPPKSAAAHVSSISSDTSGVRRYLITGGIAVLIENIGHTSMADPGTLLDFLLWGVTEFPSEHLMVILSGHGGFFIGLLSDYIGSDIRIMEQRKFAEVLSLFQRTSHTVIDILVCDVCYMNMVEVMYELTVTAGQAVRHILLAQENPVDGMPLVSLINLLETNSGHKDATDECIRNMVSREDGLFFAIRPDRDCFEGLKLSIDQLAGLILGNKLSTGDRFGGSRIVRRDSELIGIPYLLDQMNTRKVDVRALEESIMDLLRSIISGPETVFSVDNREGGLNIFLPNDREVYFRTKQYYDSLQFCRDNRWVNVLMGDVKLL